MTFIRMSAAALMAAALAGAASATAAAPAAPAEAQAAPAADEGGHDGSPDFGPGRGARGPHPGHRMGGPGLRFLRGIELGEAQQDRLFVIMHAQAPQLRELDKAERKAIEALRAMKESGQYDEARASAQSKALGQAIAARELLRVRTAAQVMALLTPQQKEAIGRGPDGERGPRGPGR